MRFEVKGQTTPVLEVSLSSTTSAPVSACGTVLVTLLNPNSSSAETAFLARYR